MLQSSPRRIARMLEGTSVEGVGRPEAMQEAGRRPESLSSIPPMTQQERRLRRLMVPTLLAAHAATVLVAMLVAYWFRFHLGPAFGVLPPIHPPGIGLYL